MSVLYLCPMCPEVWKQVWSHNLEAMRQDIELRHCDRCGYEHGFFVTDACLHTYPLCAYVVETSYAGRNLKVQVHRR